MRLSQIPKGVLFEATEDLEEGQIGQAINKLSPGNQEARDRAATHIKSAKRGYKGAYDNMRSIMHKKSNPQNKRFGIKNIPGERLSNAIAQDAIDKKIS